MILILLLIHLLLLINTQFTLWPEMVVYPYLLNNGFLLYRDIINPYPPLLIWFLTISSRIFGYFPSPYQILTWAVILIIDLSIYTITGKLFKKRFYQLTSTLFFIILSIPFGVNGLWFDLVQTPLILWSLYFFYKFLNAKRGDDLKYNLFISSLFLAVAFFIKQQVFWIILLFLSIALWKYKFNVSKFLRNHYLAALPISTLLIIQSIYFTEQGILRDFIFWVLYFPAVASKMPGYVLIPSTRQLLVVFALFGLFMPVIFKKSQPLFQTTTAILVLFAYPRFDYFHLIPALAIASVMLGMIIDGFVKSNILIKTIFLTSVVFLSLFTFRHIQEYWHSETRFFEREILKNARVLDLVIREDRIVYLQNAPDQLLPISKTLPIKPWADDFPWYLEVANLQGRVIDGLVAEKPRFIIFQPYSEGRKYDLGSYRPTSVVNYINNNYEGFARIDSDLYFKIRK